MENVAPTFFQNWFVMLFGLVLLVLAIGNFLLNLRRRPSVETEIASLQTRQDELERKQTQLEKNIDEKLDPIRNDLKDIRDHQKKNDDNLRQDFTGVYKRINQLGDTLRKENNEEIAGFRKTTEDILKAIGRLEGKTSK